MLKDRKVLLTGGCGFIGSHLLKKLLENACDVTVIDNFDPFYDESIKRGNIQEPLRNPRFKLVETDIRDPQKLESTLEDSYDIIVHLAAKAGVRPSIQDPVSYQEVNVQGTQNLLEFAKKRKIKQFVFASSSSVYGVNPNVPWSEDDHVLLPISPYASTKVSGELMGHVYSYLYGIRFIALRFFTVYGPAQRPDLAIHKFTRMILNGEAIPFFGDGSSRRDYTFVSDIVEGIQSAMLFDKSMYEVINLGNNQTVSLSEMVAAIEKATGQKATLNKQPMQPGDVPQTWANVAKPGKLLDYHPKIKFEEGIRRFVDWYQSQVRV